MHDRLTINPSTRSAYGNAYVYGMRGGAMQPQASPPAPVHGKPASTAGLPLAQRIRLAKARQPVRLDKADLDKAVRRDEARENRWHAKVAHKAAVRQMWRRAADETRRFEGKKPRPRMEPAWLW